MNAKLISDITILAKSLKGKHPELRYGQSLMNALGDINLDLYREITGTENDPFYLDSRVPVFFETIAQMQI
jgi:hypothetical protein